MSKNCPKIVFSAPPANFWTFCGTCFRHFSDILSTFSFSGLSNSLPATTLDGLIRANRFADSRGSIRRPESPEGSRTEPLFLQIAFQGTRFEAIRANRSNVMKTRFPFLHIDSHCELIRAYRPDSHCESPSHVRGRPT